MSIISVEWSSEISLTYTFPRTKWAVFWIHGWHWHWDHGSVFRVFMLSMSLFLAGWVL